LILDPLVEPPVGNTDEQASNSNDSVSSSFASLFLL